MIGDNSVTNKYLDDGDDSSIDSRDIDIHEIVRTHNLVEVKQAIAKDRPRLIAAKDEEGRIPLHIAVMNDRHKVSLFLIAKNSDINARDNEERTPLHYAAMHGLTEMCRFLLDFHANIKCRDTNCWTVLHHAVNNNHFETATLLIKRGADLNSEDHKFGRTPLHLAAELGLHRMADMLIIRGANFAASGDAFFSKTPLHLAVLNNHIETVKILCRRGADTNILSGLLDKSPLHFACEKGYADIVSVLLEYGAAVNDCGVTINGSSPLHLAVEFGHFQVIQVLLEEGKANIEIQGKFSTVGTPLHHAVRHNQIVLVRYLLDHHANINSIDANRHTPLHIACKYERYEIAAMLIEEFADHTMKSLTGKLPYEICPDRLHQEALMIACKSADITKQNIAKEKRFHEMVEEERIKKAQREEKERLDKEEAERQARENRTREFITKLSKVVNFSGEYLALIEIAQEYPDQDINVIIDDFPGTGNNVDGNNNTSSGQSKSKSSALVPVNPGALVPVTQESQALVPVITAADGALVVANQPQSNAVVVANNAPPPTVKKTRTGPGGGGTALTRAAYFGQAQIVFALLHWPGIDVNRIEQETGNTALHNAAINGNQEVIEDLLTFPGGINFGLMNYEGKVAANYASTSGLRELLRNPQMVKRRRRLQDAIMIDIFHRREEAIVSQSLAIKDIQQEQTLHSAAKDMMEVTKMIEEAKSSSFVAEIVALTGNNPITCGTSGSGSNKTSVPTLPLLSIGNGSAGTSITGTTKPTTSSSVVSLPPLPGAVASSSDKAAGSNSPSKFANSLVLANHTDHSTPLSPYQKSASAPSLLSLTGSTIASISGSTNVLPTAAALESMNHLLAKHGPVPAKFGGSRGNFFHLTYYQPQTIYEEVNAKGEKRFMDVFTLQRSYTPTAFDSTEEWCEVKDFLWLLGYPYRIKGPPLINSFYDQHDSPAVGEQQPTTEGGEKETADSGEGEHHEQHHVEATPEGEEVDPAQADQPLNNYDYSQQEYKVEKRSMVYNLSIAMDHLQRVFITPTHLISTFEWGGRTMQEQSHIDEENVKEEDLPEGMHLPSIMTQGTTTKTAITGKLSSPSLHQHHQQHPSQHEHHSSLPKNISHIDFLRLELFSDYCLKFLKEFLRLYDTYSVDYYDYLSRKEKIEYYHTHIAYLRDHCYIDVMISELLEKRLLPYCDVLRHSYDVPQFTNLMDNVNKVSEKKKKERRMTLQKKKSMRRMQSFTGSATTGETSGLLSETDGEEDYETAGEEEETDNEDTMLPRFDDPLRTLWSDLVLNPPRAMRCAIDAVYELAFSTMRQLETAYPLDTVRAHLWAHHGRLLLQKVEEEIVKTKKLQQQQKIVDMLHREEAKLQAEKIQKEQAAALALSNSKLSKNQLLAKAPLMLPSLSSPVDKAISESTVNNQEERKEEPAKEEVDVPIIDITLTPLQIWLEELHLMEYEEYFTNLGFRLLEDFEELNDQDCYRYFPFLKVGDSRRLAKHCEQLDDLVIKKYKKRAKHINNKNKGITSAGSSRKNKKATDDVEITDPASM